MEELEDVSVNSETTEAEALANKLQLGFDGVQESESSGDSSGVALDRSKKILKALEAVERDSALIADSFSSLLDSLRLSLSQATGSSVEHMNCFSDAAGRLQECVRLQSLMHPPKRTDT